MTLNEFITNLQALSDAGHGNAQVFARHGASGDCNPVGYPFATDKIDEEMGPFDLNEGETYISIYVGN